MSKRIAETITGIDNAISEAICENRPYKNVNDLIKKNQKYKNAHRRVRTAGKLLIYSFLNNDHDLMLLFTLT
ncbi:hypothetical protein RhiirA5_367246 [Rhizophagus irregularis]|uniref:Uncharacterized protein n=2 Tax=Rhizophagus irregularis TaxID=588596 RepID=U9U7D5_RHIID|nr:hypothetical protein GLOIN_2v1718658 [Rhizophagus irregularis DAOM 181602=DAOM 197198]PKB97929.1 hypothetical protein RhiirA5_367246 [Rhizophagus irregularis]POG59895.1 hypothetical protein GLOIN_2v1718658 [Rhizophagus irregularis DAOM 181602=DAOM 197198]GBC53212.1 hypothetical protein GLOIN_2v1718658 [Rhizophagus irregularis DAOM 181602=DAOM 197198]|eukprot:XP_025166761.1 hypothetical protein GLOIN_2v1718658 [Rhizophagus irregularis DAOM 181602=DAOM 197198]